MSDTVLPPSAPEHQAPPAPQRPVGNGFGLTALILGIIAVAGCAIPFFNYVTIAIAVVGLALGIVGLVVKGRPRKAATAGVILSGVGLVLSIILAVVYTAFFAGAAEAISKATVPPAGTSSVAPADDSDGTAASSGASFENGVLATDEMKIVITSHRVIAVGEPGNEYGDKPVIAFVYETTNLTNKELDPTTAWIGSFRALQDTDPNAVNELDIAGLPDERFLDTQLEKIKQGGTVENAVAYSLDDETTPVTLSASESLFQDEIGTQTFELR